MNENLRSLSTATTRVIRHHDEEYLFFGGTAYLGLLYDRAFIDLYKQGLELYGLNNGTSRSNNVQIDIYDKAEAEMALRFGFDDCILLSSGYLAAQIVVQALSGLGEFLYAPGAHPALWVSGAPLTRDLPFDQWAVITTEYINQSAGNCFVIVSNSLDNLSPQAFDFSVFNDVDPNKELYFVLDDSHGIGVKGAGSTFVDTQIIQRENSHVVLVASLAKGMGTDAGAVLCSFVDSSLFRRSTIFTGASPSSPASMYALLHGAEIFAQRSKLLQEHIFYLDTMLGAKVHRIANFPVFTVPQQGAFKHFKENGILISSFSYPRSSDPPINRIVLTAAHQKSDLERLIQVVDVLC